MKRILALLLCLMMVFSLVACENPFKSNDSSEASDSSETSDTTEKNEESGESGEPEVDTLKTLSLLKFTDYYYDYNESAHEVMLNADWENLLLDDTSAMEFPALAKYLGNELEETKKNQETSNAEMSQWAREQYEYSADSFYPYSSENRLYVQRADELILSVRQTWYSYTGGAHPNSGVTCMNIDPVTAQPLLLSDVLTTTDSFATLLHDKLRETYGLEHIESLSQLLQEYAIADFTWTMNYDGVTVYFSPYEIASYADGLLMVFLPFADYPDLFVETYTQKPETGSVMSLPDYGEIKLDLNPGDGMVDTLYISATADEYDIYTNLRLDINGNVLEDHDFWCFDFSAYLVTFDDATRYLYIETSAESDHRTLSVYKITQTGISLVDSLDGFGFAWVFDPDAGEYGTVYDKVFTDPSAFTLTARTDVLGTMSGYKLYRADTATGSPVTDDEYFSVSQNTNLLTAKIDVPATLSDGTAGTIAAGTVCSYLYTDNETFMQLQAEDGTEYRVDVDSSGWPRLIGGIPEDECFEGILYAG